MNFKELEKRLKEVDERFFYDEDGEGIRFKIKNGLWGYLGFCYWNDGVLNICNKGGFPSEPYLKGLKVLAEFMLGEEDKRYIIPLPKLKDSWGEQLYLTQDGKRWFTYPRNKELRQTWKKKHLKWIPEEYRQFAVEVEED